MSPSLPPRDRDPWAAALHTLRPFRLLARHARYSALWQGGQREAAITAALTHVYVEVNHFLASLEVPWWLTYGTLLGCHRDGGLVPGDKDIDFGLPVSAYPAVWEARRRLPRGFRMFDTSSNHRGPKLYVAHRGWEADLYFYRTRDDGLLESCERSWRQGDVAPFPEALVFPLRDAVFLGQPTWVPADARAWLLHTYGCIDRGAVQDRRTGYWHAPVTVPEGAP